MIRIERIFVNGTEYLRTYSDGGVMIERDGILYLDAVDPVSSGRSYTETDMTIIN